MAKVGSGKVDYREGNKTLYENEESPILGEHNCTHKNNDSDEDSYPRQKLSFQIFAIAHFLKIIVLQVPNPKNKKKTNLIISLAPATRIKSINTHSVDTAISAIFLRIQNCTVSLNSLYSYRDVLPVCKFDG